jgi:hypothetical protein
LGRRVKKAVYAYGSGAWELQKEILFVYDGWNLIQEKEVSGTGDPLFDKFYVWGLDLFQSIQGAGGIGGLVYRVSGGKVRHYFYDANGNVGQMVNPADGSQEYGTGGIHNPGSASGLWASKGILLFDCYILRSSLSPKPPTAVSGVRTGIFSFKKFTSGIPAFI